MTDNITLSSHTLTALERKARYGHEGAVIWLTGLSAAGKSALAMALEQALCARLRLLCAGRRQPAQRTEC